MELYESSGIVLALVYLFTGVVISSLVLKFYEYHREHTEQYKVQQKQVA